MTTVYTGQRSRLRWPVQTLSRWRVEHKVYGLPLDRRLVEWLKPAQVLS